MTVQQVDSDMGRVFPVKAPPVERLATGPPRTSRGTERPDGGAWFRAERAARTDLPGPPSSAWTAGPETAPRPAHPGCGTEDPAPGPGRRSWRRCLPQPETLPG